MAHSIASLPLAFSDILPSDGVELLHEKSLEIMAEMGVVVKHEAALDLLESHGCEVDRESQLVRFPRSLVADCIESTPERFTVHAREEANDLTIGGGDRLTAPVYGPTNVLTYESGRRNSTIEDYELFMKLVRREDPITSTGYSVCEPNDVPQETKHVEMLLRSLRMTDKPVMASTYGEERARTSLEMVGIAHDDPELSEPYAVGVVNTVPPRQWDGKMTGGLMEYAKREQPIIVTPGVMSAASGPATLAGSLALSNAETLVGIVIGQLVSPGTPMVYSLSGIPIDIRHGTYSTGSPEGRILTAVAEQMGRRYEIPVRGWGSDTDAKTINTQSGSESILSVLVSMATDTDVIVHAAGGLDSFSAASPEKFVLDTERMRLIDHLLDPFALDEDAFALDLIEDIEPGGHFLNEQHTLSHGRAEHFFPDLFERRSHDDWQQAGEPDPFESAHEYVRAQIEAYERPAMDPDVERDLEAFADARREEILGAD